ncbi:uncharacterized protein LOC124149235 isoform X2 [Haliotis rufescens]|uniref:uncharacterized protein LOC124149235 isoform X2 n=1 Tax=Haliotis rufescens TaxID=6454 RepID=UPI001EB079F7|nr:uncharacterized protein LOC124149235 isoform X2 [Haliotis rufescens]
MMKFSFCMCLCIVVSSWTVLQVQGGDPWVYFASRLGRDTRFGVGSAVVFDRVAANIGNGYNPTSGIFTAPFSGYYEFKCQLLASSPGCFEYALVSQGSYKAIILFPCSSFATKTMSAIFHVTAGHHVWVKSHHIPGTLRGGIWSQFSGRLVRKD